MNIGHVFRISIYSLTALVGCVLGAAEERSGLPYLSIPISIVGYFWCEGKRHRRVEGHQAASVTGGMSDLFASIWGLIAVYLTGREFMGPTQEDKLLAGIHLVVYLSWIVLLQRKDYRRYWLLMALGLLQMAVASVLTTAGWFGFCAMAYLFAAVWTLSVFSLFRAEQQFFPDGSLNEDESISTKSGDVNTVNNPVIVDSHRDHSGNVPAAADQPGMNPARVSAAFDSVCLHEGTFWPAVPFMGGVLFVGLGCLLVSAFFFALTPRVWIGTGIALANEDLEGIRSRSVTGFATEIRLGALGSILESVEPVLEMKLTDEVNDTVITPWRYAEALGQPEPLLRGAVLVDYQRGHWSQFALQRNWVQPLPRMPDTERRGVRQEIRLHPLGTNVLFCMNRATAVADERGHPAGQKHLGSDIALRGEDSGKPGMLKTGVYTYTAYSDWPSQSLSGIVGLRFLPQELTRIPQGGLRDYMSRMTSRPVGVDRLQQLARSVVSELTERIGREPTNLEKARALEFHLGDSQEYSYSLNLTVIDPKIDPIEDFLFNRKAGHCEYFATALTLMLRSVDVPARLVTGYKGGAYDANTGVFTVRQNYSHAWVEALIDDRVWVTLDATPSEARTASVAAVATKKSVWNKMRQQFSSMWTENVVNVSFEQQEQLFYRPLREFFVNLLEDVRAMWASPKTSIVAFFRWFGDPRNWFSGQGLLLIAWLVSVGWIVRRWAVQRGISLWGKRKTERTHRTAIEFYERFLRLMRSRGLERQPAETPLEFAVSAGETLAGDPATQSFRELPKQLSEHFNRIRFGDESLPTLESDRIRGQLDELESALKARSVV